MRVFGWAFVGVAALMLGLGFAVLSESLLMAAVPVVGVLLVAAYLSRERRQLHQPGRGANGRRGTSTETGYAVIYSGTTDGGAHPGGDCGFGGDGGGSSGGDAGGC